MSTNQKIALENYKTLSGTYSTMSTQVNQFRADLAKNRAILNAAESDIRQQRARIAMMDNGPARDAAIKQADSDSEKVRKARLEQKAKEDIFIQMSAELETMKPPPMQPMSGE